MSESVETSIWMNGNLLGRANGRVAVSDSLFQHGFGVFTTMRAYGGRVFRLAEHLKRLSRSAEALGIEIGYERDTLAAAVGETIEANALSDARVRVTVSRGDLAAVGEKGELTAAVVVQAGPMTAYPAELYERGMTVAISDTRHNETDPMLAHKIGGNYAMRLWVLRQAQLKRCGEALMFTLDRRLAGGSISNVFVVREGTVRTPPLTLSILGGITRAVVLELCASGGIPCEEADVTIDDLLDADEVFVTNSVMEVMPVRSVEAKEIGPGKPGELTRRIAGLYRESVEKECE